LESIKNIASKLGINIDSIRLDFSDNLEHGDYSCNIAMLCAKDLKMDPKELAEKIVNGLKDKMPNFVESVSVAGPGFINFKLKSEVIARGIVKISENGVEYGRVETDKGKEILIEYTDPNTFKAFHIGHLMTNAIGESLSRLIEYCGAKTVRICYASDIGLHIAKSIWAMQKHISEIPADSAPIVEKTAFLGKMYVEGTTAYDANSATKDDIDALNQVIYEGKSPEIIALYKKGRKWSLDHFEMLYEVLGTRFDETIYESEMAPVGLGIVRAYLEKNIFEKSEGAVIFKGEKYGLHTRVFINSAGLPTYETKDMGLNATKFKRHPNANQSIIVTANEQNDYFKVIEKALSIIDPNIGSKLIHIGHGMMRFVSGKMSSRKGNVVAAEALIADIKEIVAEKIVGREFSREKADKICEIVAVAAIKYSILRSSIGSDIVFDSAKSISFEGDSGPYLQYSAVRAAAVLERAKQEGISGAILTDLRTLISSPTIGISGTTKESSGPSFLGDESEVGGVGSHVASEKGSEIKVRKSDSVNYEILGRLVIRFPEIIERARNEYTPQHVANYLTNLAGAFNSFYASQTIVDKNDRMSPYYVALTRAFLATMTNGLWVLGIKIPERM